MKKWINKKKEEDEEWREKLTIFIIVACLELLLLYIVEFTKFIHWQRAKKEEK